MIVSLDQVLQRHTGEPSQHRHEELEQSKVERQAKDGPHRICLPQRARDQAHREGVHRHAQRDQKDFVEWHTILNDTAYDNENRRGDRLVAPLFEASSPVCAACKYTTCCATRGTPAGPIPPGIRAGWSSPVPEPDPPAGTTQGMP